MSDEEKTHEPTPITDAESMVDFLVGAEGSPETEEAPPTDEPEVSDEETAATSEAADEDALDEAEAEDDSVESEEEEEDSDSESEDTETDEDETEAEESEEEEPEPETVYELDGESITLDELKAGYLRQSDYTAKTQELADGRQALQEQTEGLKQYEDTLAQNLALTLQVLEPQLAELMNTDWDSLLASDAYEYQQKRGEFEQAQHRYAQVQEAARQQVAARQQQAQEALKAKRTAERDKLVLALPDLADARKGRDLAHGIKEYAIKSVGLTEAEAAQMVDHRLIVTLNKARQFDELKEAGLTLAEKKVKAGPKKTISSGKPQSKTVKKSRQQGAAKQRLAESGSADALVDMLVGGN